MAEQDLREAFSDCIDRMVAGQSIGDCLRQYPQYAAMLRPMLEAGSLVERTQASSFEIAAAQARVRNRVNERLRTPPPVRRSYGRFVLLVASLLIAFAAVLGAAENSLPGDALYNIKRLSENARSALIGEQFGGRRLDEIRVLLALKREANIDFYGEVEQIEGAHWRVAGLDLQVGAATPGVASAAVNDQVHITAQTTAQGDLVAQTITLLEKAIAPSPTPSATATITASPTPTSSPTSTELATRIAPTFTPIASSTLPVKPEPTGCTPTMPSGWVRYVVQAGDLVTMLAQKTGASVAQLMAVNCLPDTQMIIVGQTLFLPSQPVFPSGATQPSLPPSQPTAASGQPTDDHGHDGGDDHGGDHGGGDDGGGSSGHGGGNSGGPG